MNTKRRKAIARAIDEYMNRESEAREALVEALEEIRDEEEEAYENLPESLQDGERGDAMQDAISSLEDFLSELEDGPFYDELDTLREELGIEEE